MVKEVQGRLICPTKVASVMVRALDQVLPMRGTELEAPSKAFSSRVQRSIHSVLSSGGTMSSEKRALTTELSSNVSSHFLPCPNPSPGSLQTCSRYEDGRDLRHDAVLDVQVGVGVGTKVGFGVRV